MDKITKLPWRIMEDVIPDFPLVGIMNNSGDVVIPAKSIRRHDAEYICLAVNERKKLLKDREGLVEAAKLALYHFTGSNINEKSLIKKLEEALKAADGEGVK